MAWFISMLLGLLAAVIVKGFVNYGNVYPTAYTLSENLSITDTTRYGDGPIVLSPAQPYLTLDYGVERAGFPFIEVASLSGPTQIEVKYSEEFPALTLPTSDGPWTFTIGLANTFRHETFNLTDCGKTTSYFIQGGQRWQTIRLLTNTTVTLAAVGFNSTAAHLPVSELPSQFSSSNPLYDDIWALGGRVVQSACVDAGNALSTWEITEDGALIRGQGTAQSAKGASFANYTMSFATRTARGGTGWRVAAQQNPTGAYFVLTSNYPAESTFLNTNLTLMPANTLIFTYGISLVEQVGLPINPAQHFPMDYAIEESTWYNIATTITPTDYVVSINGTTVATIELATLPPVSTFTEVLDPQAGSFGFGPWNDQAAYFTDVKVVAHNGTLLYQNDPKSTDILREYAQGNLDTSVCMDGAKRDRLVWSGDFYHTVSVVAHSTARYDYLIGTIEYLFARQLTDAPYEGFVPISPYLGGSPEFKRVQDSYSGLLDYADLLLAGVGDYYRYTGNTGALQPLWPNIKALVDARNKFIDPYSGLIGATAEVPYAYNFLGPANGSAVTALHAYALKSLAPLADALRDHASARAYLNTADELSGAINHHLWNPALGTYSLSVDDPGNFSINAIAWTILSGTANSSQAASSIAKLEELRCGIGYMTISSEICNDAYQLSPNTNGFLLNALFKAHQDHGVEDLTAARVELNDFWSAMVTQNEYYSGASWEYVHPNGKPGLERFTSLAHPWGAASTYVLPTYVLGISATSAGYKTWTFTPLLEGLNLTEAKGTIVTPYGDINASWEITGDHVVLSVDAPAGTQGTLVLPKGCSATYNNKRHRGGRISLKAGKHASVRVSGWMRQ